MSALGPACPGPRSGDTNPPRSPVSERFRRVHLDGDHSGRFRPGHDEALDTFRIAVLAFVTGAAFTVVYALLLGLRPQ